MGERVVVTRPVMGQEWGIWALVYMQVCAERDCPREVVEAGANRLNPTGISSTWRINEKGPNGEDLAPVVCEQDPNRLHYMLSC